MMPKSPLSRYSQTTDTATELVTTGMKYNKR